MVVALEISSVRFSRPGTNAGGRTVIFERVLNSLLTYVCVLTSDAVPFFQLTDPINFSWWQGKLLPDLVSTTSEAAILWQRYET